MHHSHGAMAMVQRIGVTLLMFQRMSAISKFSTSDPEISRGKSVMFHVFEELEGLRVESVTHTFLQLLLVICRSTVCSAVAASPMGHAVFLGETFAQFMDVYGKFGGEMESQHMRWTWCSHRRKTTCRRCRDDLPWEQRHGLRKATNGAA